MPSSTLIAVATAGRLYELERLLLALSEQYGSRRDVGLLVIDNDQHATSRPVVMRYAAEFRGGASYAVEPERGYAAVRNAVLRHAGDADPVVLIDDDEVPEAGWLDALTAAQAITGADVVAGPVVTVFPDGTPEWIRSSGVFGLEAPLFAEGEEMPWCATNNTLIRLSGRELVPEGFDPRFNMSSGEDSHYFARVRLRGGRITWTNEAVVREYVTRDRLQRRWMFRRAVRAANHRTLLEMELSWGPQTLLTRCAKTVGLLVLAVACALRAAACGDPAYGLRALHRAGNAYGVVLAFWSKRPFVA